MAAPRDELKEIFDLHKDWEVTLKHQAGSLEVTATLPAPAAGVAPTDTGITLTLSPYLDSRGVWRGIVLDK